MNAEEFCLVGVAVRDTEEARRLGRWAVREKWAACANIFSGVQSIYEWKGELHEEPEIWLQLKTRKQHVEALIDALAGQHSYECPGIVVLPWVGAHAPYLTWVQEQTQRE